MACNKLMINPSKSQVLIYSYSQRQSQFDLNLTINYQYLSISDSVKYLGMIFDSQLKFDQHIAYITKNFRRLLELWPNFIIIFRKMY